MKYQKSTKNWFKALPEGEELFAFFTREIPLLRQLGEVRIGKKLRELYLDAQQHRPTIEIEENGSWLDIHFDVSGIAESEIDAVLRSLLQADRFYTTPSAIKTLSGGRISLAEDAESVSIWRHTCRRNGIREDSSNNQLLVVRKAREATVECSDRCTCEFDV